MYNFEYYPKKPGLIPKLITYYHLFRIKLLKKRKPLTNTEAVEMAHKNKKLVIQIMYGGLGDHLIYSSLPRLLWEKYKIKTEISNKSLYRSPEIRKFVWESNPYVTFTDKKGWSFGGNVPENKTFDRIMQEMFDLESNGSPEVFYKSNRTIEVLNKTIVDVSFGPAGKVAYKYHTEEFLDSLVKYIKKNLSEFILITHTGDGYSNREAEKRLIKEFNPPHFDVSTLSDLADVYTSAKERYLLFSGSASVVAALKQPSTILCNMYIDQRFAYKSINKYIDIKKQNL
ncbi:MAG: hypothetical protein WAV10_03540 [Minisyncoccia bacterium]